MRRSGVAVPALPAVFAGLLLLGSAATAQHAPPLAYPPARTVDQVDDYHGTAVADPYRWMEDAGDPELQAWIAAQARLTEAYLAAIPERERIRERLTRLWNYERVGVPTRQGERLVYSRNDGLQPQSVVYKAARSGDRPEVLFDPNAMAADGSVSIAGMTFTDDGRYVAYAISRAGSDWREWRIRNVGSGRDLPEVVTWSKFGGAAWRKDGSGFYYNRYAPPAEGEALTAVNKHQKLYFHRRGTDPAADELVYERPDRPEWMFGAQVTEDGRFLLIGQSESTDPKNRVFLRDLSRPDAAIEPFLDAYDASYQVIGNDGERFYVLTDRDAPRNRLVAIDRARPAPEHWTTLIAEAPGSAILASARMIADRFVVVWRADAHDRVRVYRVDGAFDHEIELPTLGTVGMFTGRRREPEGFFSFTSFTHPTTVYRHEFARRRTSEFHRPRVDFRPEDFETRQVFYTSRDGTRVPMFIVHRRGLRQDGSHPAYLYGYGGFGVSQTPSFSTAVIAWMEMGGVYAVANLRGGMEYGRAWHDAGRLANKQNVFDDFIAAGEHLVAEGFTSTGRLAIGGRSNGGLLVGACVNQRPDLFAAAVPGVGVMDMLRFHKFTIGWAWVSDYGSAETPAGFATLFRYSPLHNIRPGGRYPAVLVITGDHDDRVVPAHSFKYTAALQAAQAGPRPIVMRVTTRSGHGAGRSTQRLIDEQTDVWAFLVRELGMRVDAGAGGAHGGR